MKKVLWENVILHLMAVSRFYPYPTLFNFQSVGAETEYSFNVVLSEICDLIWFLHEKWHHQDGCLTSELLWAVLQHPLYRLLLLELLDYI